MRLAESGADVAITYQNSAGDVVDRVKGVGAAAIASLASDGARYVTGAQLHVDGDFTT